MIDSSSRQTTLDVCFGCDQVRWSSEGVQDAPAAWKAEVHFDMNSGKTIPGTDYRIIRFEKKERVDPAIGKEIDVSELMLKHTSTGEAIVLRVGALVEVP